jgi:hypothetical protein
VAALAAAHKACTTPSTKPTTSPPPRSSCWPRYIQAPWNRKPTEYRAFAESYYKRVKPLLIKAGLAKG